MWLIVPHYPAIQRRLGRITGRWPSKRLMVGGLARRANITRCWRLLPTPRTIRVLWAIWFGWWPFILRRCVQASSLKARGAPFGHRREPLLPP